MVERWQISKLLTTTRVHQLLQSMRVDQFLGVPSLTTKFRVMVLWTTSCCQLLAASALTAEELSCADDCISAIELLWIGGESDETKQSAINDITDQLVRRGHEDISGIAIQQMRYVFVAFKKRCDERETKLAALLEEAIGFLQPGIEFRVVDGPFVRGPNTIDFDGEYWDGSLCCQS